MLRCRGGVCRRAAGGGRGAIAAPLLLLHMAALCWASLLAPVAAGGSHTKPPERPHFVAYPVRSLGDSCDDGSATLSDAKQQPCKVASVFANAPPGRYNIVKYKHGITMVEDCPYVAYCEIYTVRARCCAGTAVGVPSPPSMLRGVLWGRSPGGWS